MPDQKLENLLNLAMNALPHERAKSGNLNVGYDPTTRLWDVIVKYSEPERGLGGDGIQVVPLLGGYAVVTLPETELDAYSDREQVEFIEKPKRLYFETFEGREASCILPVQAELNGLTGEGILVGIVDSGVDYFHPDFRNEDGTTRIMSLWDQTIQRPKRNDAMETDITSKGENISEEGTEDTEDTGKIKEGTGEEIRGVEYTKEQINEALAAGSREAGYRIVPSRDLSGHGTEVLGIAAGNGQASGGQYRGVASKSDILVVKIGTAGSEFAGTVELMLALDYVIRKAMELGKPVAINLSFGNVYGSHVPYTRGILGLNRS